LSLSSIYEPQFMILAKELLFQTIKMLDAG